MHTEPMGRSSGVFPVGAVHDVDLPEDLARLVTEVLDAQQMAEDEAAERLAERVLLLARLARAAAGRRVGRVDAATACAKKLGLTRRTLQPYMLVARCWTEADLRQLLCRRAACGHRLTPSHLLWLSRLSRTERVLWTERALAQGMGSRELREATIARLTVRGP